MRRLVLLTHGAVFRSWTLGTDARHDVEDCAALVRSLVRNAIDKPGCQSLKVEIHDNAAPGHDGDDDCDHEVG